MQEQDEEIIEEISYQTILEKKGLTPCVFDGFDLNPPAPFNTVTISLNGNLSSDLNWKTAVEQAEKAIKKGYALLWDMDLGLFNRLSLPIANQTQFLSLGLSLEHFKNTLGKEFRDHSIGISIYRGSADFSYGFNWEEDQIINLRSWLQEHFLDEAEFSQIICSRKMAELTSSDLCNTQEGKMLVKLFCRDVAAEYLALLAGHLPDWMPCCLFLDRTNLNSLSYIQQLQLLNPDRFDFAYLVLKGEGHLPFNSWGWHSHATSNGYAGSIPQELPASPETKIGVCLPLMNYHHPMHWANLESALKILVEKSLPFRLISESHLINQWEGLDFLFYNPKGLSPQGKRKLQGFCAAAGEVVSVGEKLGLTYETTFSDWLSGS